ncbi:YqiA/YcfP family alpha/beta fold hydrolase [Shewanella gelidii]|uniref:Uncharacterized protein n=1 Tax=Shewanella gelidii TaxID=1642821 RepID=A0A917NAI5_9GAMM|nr:YqiA/YcfP family alpha/beta fold hydrolase [Shewanella gelidii]MCL1097876.1 hypothetical protein [Shewanella gelidii]GGI78027.1 hypothetical protein GCM10009332_14300 [Shewanella gelidii]
MYLYLHGLGSGGQSSTVTGLKQAGLEVTSVDYQPEFYSQSIQALTDLIMQQPITGVLGTSMGGYYALKLSELTGLRAVAVNVCFEPAKHLQKYLHQPAMNYVTQQPIRIDQAMLDDFAPINPALTPLPTIVIGEQDDLIPAAYQKQFCQNSQWPFITTDWGHRVSNKAKFAEIIRSTRSQG